MDRIENIADDYLDSFGSVDVDEYDRIFQKAKERALDTFENWNEITGVLPTHTSYYFEVKGCIIDAVHCGVQRALRIQVPLRSEENDA